MQMVSTNAPFLESKRINNSSNDEHVDKREKRFSTLRSIGIDHGLARTGLAVTVSTVVTVSLFISQTNVFFISRTLSPTGG